MTDSIVLHAVMSLSGVVELASPLYTTTYALFHEIRDATSILSLDVSEH